MASQKPWTYDKPLFYFVQCSSKTGNSCYSNLIKKANNSPGISQFLKLQDIQHFLGS